MATRPLPESALVTDLDGAIIILEADEARWRERVAKMARDWALPLSKEGDTCGWSSAVQERDLALRRRRGPAYSSRRGCGWVGGAAAAADEHSCGGKESMPSDALEAKKALQTETKIDNSFLVHFYLNVL